MDEINSSVHNEKILVLFHPLLREISDQSTVYKKNDEPILLFGKKNIEVYFTYFSNTLNLEGGAYDS